MEKNQDIKYSPHKISRSKKYGNNYWTSRGNKLGKRNIELYSDLEFDHWLTVETNPEVITYCEQPLKISYVLKGKLRTSIFDMWILNQDSSETFVEVKYEKELTSNHPKYDRTKRQIEAQQEWCRLNQKFYEVRTEKTIRRGRHSIENRKSIVTAVLNSQKPACISDVLACITVCNKKIQEIIKEISHFPKEDVNLALKWLYYTGYLSGDIENQIWGNQLEVFKK
ncbi:TnsA endonuclease N-terminal domain-containing protein [Paenibacillus xylanexedens]|uniref:TnsA endonuclease N-terminal domain-containing protein n=1 Tax=Paenibacillus xylanexedens TaxID=528191 RepID=UPI001F1ADD2F|nr:TnsA endonuclease N-terminal domain-containing protein [Paenibacillus xylanexedens]MCF7753960.1 TnsA endonuclease N-terminal domain-containing protein [Paenibacillus xylanexedens]